ncbi:uncharacterized [Lates japonicus]
MQENGVVFDCCGPFCHQQPLSCPTDVIRYACDSDKLLVLAGITRTCDLKPGILRLCGLLNLPGFVKVQRHV